MWVEGPFGTKLCDFHKADIWGCHICSYNINPNFESLKFLFCMWVSRIIRLFCSMSRCGDSSFQVSSFVPGRYGNDFKGAIFKLFIHNTGLAAWCTDALTWIPKNLLDDKSTLVQVMAWCHQVTSQYLYQCRPRSISPYGMIMAKWVNEIKFKSNQNLEIDYLYKIIFKCTQLLIRKFPIRH